jgi:hypothetical protein
LVEDWLGSGLLECAYQRIPEGGLAIASVDSTEKLWETIHAYPLYHLFDWQVEPLADLRHVLKAQCQAGGSADRVQDGRLGG